MNRALKRMTVVAAAAVGIALATATQASAINYVDPSHMVSTSGLAQAAPNDGSVPPTPSGRWHYVKWYQGHTLNAFVQCNNEAGRLYPGRPFECRSASDNTTQLWVWL